MSIQLLFLLLFTASCLFIQAMSVNPSAITPTVDSSDTYPVGTDWDGLVSTSDDPIAPFSEQGVHFKGWASGGSAEKRGEAYLVYRFRIEFPEEVQLDCITVGGAGDQSVDAVLRLLDENMNELVVQPTFGFNTYGLHFLQANGATGTVFYLDEFDNSTTWCFRDRIVFECAELTPKLNPSTGNWYQAIPAPEGIDWTSARNQAETYSLEIDPGVVLQGHLATLTCPSENLFILQEFPYAVSGRYWLGGYQPLDDPTTLDENPSANW